MAPSMLHSFRRDIVYFVEKSYTERSIKLRKPAREPHLHGVLAACLRSFSRTLTADSRIKSIDRGNIIWYHIHALAVTEDSATVRTDTSAVNGVGGKSDAMR